MADKIQYHEIIPTIESVIDESITFHDEEGAKVREKLIESLKSVTAMHVRASLHSAAGKIDVKVVQNEANEITDIIVNKKEVLDSYPLENIK